MRWNVLAFSLVAPLLLTACETIPDGPLTEPADVSDVLTVLKRELQLVSSVAPAYVQDAAVQTCSGTDGAVRIVLTPDTATLVMKVIATNAGGVTGGVKFPIGGVVTANLGGGYSRTYVKTQNVTFDLGIAHDPTKRELRAAAGSVMKEIDDDAKAAKALDSFDPAVSTDITNSLPEKRGKLSALYKGLLAPAAVGPAQAPPVDANKDGIPDALEGAPLAIAVWKAREELLEVDHTQTPCLKPGKLKMEIGFQVVRKAEGKAGISFLIVELGAQASQSDDRTQMLTVNFDLADSSTIFAKQRARSARPTPRGEDRSPAFPSSSPSASEPSGGPAGEFVTYPFGTVQREAIWNLKEWNGRPDKPISVCWENPTSSDEDLRQHAQAAVVETWEAVSKIRFVGWSACGANSKGIRIRISDEGPHVKSLGRYLDGRPDGMVLNFQFEKWSPSCKTNKVFCLKAVTAHEFGHALAFAHEQNRADAPFECQKEAQGTTGNWNVTTYDPDSIMNYCNVKWNNNGGLSARDVEAVQTIYGAK